MNEVIRRGIQVVVRPIIPVAKTFAWTAVAGFAFSAGNGLYKKTLGREKKETK